MSDILDLVSWIEFLKYNYEVVLKIATKKSNVLSSLDNRFVLYVCVYVCMYVCALIVLYKCINVCMYLDLSLLFKFF